MYIFLIQKTLITCSTHSHIFHFPDLSRRLTHRPRLYVFELSWRLFWTFLISFTASNQSWFLAAVTSYSPKYFHLHRIAFPYWVFCIATISPTLCFRYVFFSYQAGFLFYSHNLNMFFFIFSLMISDFSIINSVYSSFKIFLMFGMSLPFICLSFNSCLLIQRNYTWCLALLWHIFSNFGAFIEISIYHSWTILTKLVSLFCLFFPTVHFGLASICMYY